MNNSQYFRDARAELAAPRADPCPDVFRHVCVRARARFRNDQSFVFPVLFLFSFFDLRYVGFWVTEWTLPRVTSRVGMLNF